jgi:hypothetical protein
MAKVLRFFSVLLIVVIFAHGRLAFGLSTMAITISGAQQAGTSGNITIAFSDSSGNNYTETVTYGPFSTPASIAAAFGAMFSNSYISKGLCAHATGAEVIFQLQGTATLGAATITNGSSPFSITNTSSIPTITSILPNPAVAGAAVVVYGVSFGSSQGTVTFNGVNATVSSWSSTAIAVTVPQGASSGNVIVSVSGQSSDGFPFTVPILCIP